MFGGTHRDNEIIQFDQDDPFLMQGDHLLYQGSHKVNIYICQKPESKQKLPNQEQLIVKILLVGELQNPKALKIELISDNELNFYFHFSCNEMQFQRIRDKQKFYIQFRQYPEIVVKNFEQLTNPHSQFEVSFIILSEMEGRMQIIRKSEFKDDKIMEFEFVRAMEDHIKTSVQHRYDIMRQQYIENKQKHEEFREIIRAKNPSLMMQIDKAMKNKK